MADHDFFDDSKPTTFMVDRTSSYAKNTGKGFRGDYWNSHHVLPCIAVRESLNKFLQPKPLYYKRALGRFTKWDINESYNLLGLPNEAAYLKAYGDPAFSKLDFDHPTWKPRMRPSLTGAPHGPIHLPTSWGHAKYNTDVRKQLDPIWDDLSVEAKNHRPIKADDMSAAIQDVSDVFCAKLEARTGQTRKRWEDEDDRQKYFRMA
jgi:hypothetical protein